MRRSLRGFPLLAISTGNIMVNVLAPVRLHKCGPINSTNFLSACVAGIQPSSSSVSVLHFHVTNLPDLPCPCSPQTTLHSILSTRMVLHIRELASQSTVEFNEGGNLIGFRSDLDIPLDTVRFQTISRIEAFDKSI